MGSSAYDYEGIPVGFYDAVFRGGNPVRRLWHLSKFERVLDCLPPRDAGSLLDIGCFAGSFLSLVSQTRFARQLGVDILHSQVEYARARYGTGFREFRHLPDLRGLATVQETFDCITAIEIIEHLAPDEACELLRQIAVRLAPGGRLVMTTPNYTSAWPILEAVLNRFSDVTYEEQHVTRFDYFRIERQLRDLYPDFERDFTVELKTTTHLFTPFLAGLSFRAARRLSRLVSHQKWRLPFGNLVMLVVRRKGRSEGQVAEDSAAWA
ncbi:MAG: class I SAM-dependent methyltransferase [Deltaproteobacteria bacterium]|nr:MAG: class I SAM-dependent methyltransferase [Deltaproteobacteria bacterium]TMB26332.1 MAG: class I SAM-dependent methyltransferase [Deltaproteobacteria bacterium]